MPDPPTCCRLAEVDFPIATVPTPAREKSIHHSHPPMLIEAVNVGPVARQK